MATVRRHKAKPTAKRGELSNVFASKSEAKQAARKMAAKKGAHVTVRDPNGVVIAKSTVHRISSKRLNTVVIEGRIRASETHEPKSKRVATYIAVEAQRDFARLRGYFETAADLGRALGWSAPTVRKWMNADLTPNRPRESSVEILRAILLVANEARNWVSDPFDVGAWLVTPIHDLADLTPAEVVHSHDAKRDGANWIISRLPSIAPRSRRRNVPKKIDFEAVAEVLSAFDTKAFAEIEPISAHEVDLSMFDD